MSIIETILSFVPTNYRLWQSVQKEILLAASVDINFMCR